MELLTNIAILLGCVVAFPVVMYLAGYFFGGGFLYAQRRQQGDFLEGLKKSTAVLEAARKTAERAMPKGRMN